MVVDIRVQGVDQSIALWMTFRRTSRLLAKVRQRELAVYDISDDASAALFTVSSLGRQAIPATISRYLFLEQHSVSQLLTRMENSGLIRRVRDLERKNSVRIELTAEGREAFVKCSRQRSMKTVMSVLSEEEQQEMWPLLVRLRERGIKRLAFRHPLFYPPSDRRAVLDAAEGLDTSLPSVDPAVALYVLLGRTSRLVGKARQRELDDYGVSVDAAAVLFTVARLGMQAIPATISKYQFLERHSVSQILTRMGKDGLIRRVKDLEPRNYVRIELTQKGREILLKAGKHRSTRHIMSVLSTEEQSDMFLLLEKIRDRAIRKLGLKDPLLRLPAEPLPTPERANAAVLSGD